MQTDPKLVKLFQHFGKGTIKDGRLTVPRLSDSEAIFLGGSLLGLQIQGLELPWNRLSAEGIRSLGIGLEGASVSVLIMRYTTLETYHLDALAPYLAKSKLYALDVSHNLLGDSREFIAALRGSRITHLDLSHNNLTDITLNRLLRVVRNTQLRYVNLNGNYDMASNKLNKLVQAMFENPKNRNEKRAKPNCNAVR